MKTVKKIGQASWHLKSDRAEAWITRQGGMLGPAVFRIGGRVIEPYSVAPWAEEKLPPDTLPILPPVRGDFFCLPFGYDRKPFRGERHPIHGEPPNSAWQFERFEHTADQVLLGLSLTTKIRPGTITKEIALRRGHSAVYQRHIISGMSGPMSFGHHALLRFPAHEGSGNIAVSPFLFGQVCPIPLENPAAGGYSNLRAGARFTSLRRVATADGALTDLSRYPARAGYDDVVTLASDPTLPFTWTTVTFPRERFVWFSLKNPRELGQTLLWFSNGGRHFPPWNGRHRAVAGLEEITGMATGLPDAVAANPFSRAGSPTFKRMSPRQPTVARSIQGVAPIPAGFDVVASIRPVPGGIVLRSKSGRVARARLELDFVL